MHILDDKGSDQWSEFTVLQLTWSMMESRVLRSRKPLPLTRYSPSATMWLSSSSSSRASALWATALHSWCTSVRNSLASVLLAPLMSELQQKRKNHRKTTAQSVTMRNYHTFYHSHVKERKKVDISKILLNAKCNLTSFYIHAVNMDTNSTVRYIFLTIKNYLFRCNIIYFCQFDSVKHCKTTFYKLQIILRVSLSVEYKFQANPVKNKWRVRLRKIHTQKKMSLSSVGQTSHTWKGT